MSAFFSAPTFRWVQRTPLFTTRNLGLKKGKAGVDFDVVFLSGNLGGASERNDVQSIKFTIACPTSEQLVLNIWSDKYVDRYNE